MRALGLQAQLQRKKRRPTDSDHPFPRYPNLVVGLEVVRPEQVWVSNLTDIRLRYGLVYLAVIMDVFTRALRGWHLGRNLDPSLTLTALQRALARYPAPEIHHSDQGIQYAATASTRVLQEAGVRISMAEVGEAWQNGYAERLIRMINAVADGLGVLEVAPTREEIAAQIAAVAAGRRWRPILVLAIDGADVPTRPEAARGRRRGRKRQRAKRARWTGQWREAKGFRYYLVDDDRIVHLPSWHQIQDDEALFAALQQVKDAGLIPEEQVRLGVLADGARWIWNRIKALFPTVEEILDSYHGSEHVHALAVVQYEDRPDQALEWVEATMARLFCGEVDGVIWGVQRMPPATAEAASEIEKLMAYLRSHRDRINYRSQRKAGYPLGSGGIESANTFICHVRLKRSGAWWYVANGNHMLALRCAKYNGTFDRIFERYRQKMLEKSRQNNP
jgi:transposase InsO family protein